MLPIRKTYSGDVPVDGSSGNYEWEGFIPFDQLPSAFNPPSGLIASGNQNPFPANYPYAAGGNFMDYYRVKQIRDRLSARKGWRAEEMPSVQKDVYSAFSRFLAQSLVAACDRLKVTNPALQEPLRQLRTWNGQMEKDQAAPLIAALAFQHLRRAVMEKAAPGKGPLSNRQPSSEILEKFLRTRPSGWFPDYDQMLVRVLADAVEEGTRIQGRRVEKWEYGRYLNVLIPHPVGHRLRFLASYFDLGPVPMGGSGTTVKQTTWRLGPSMRMNADLADWDQSLLMVPIGQSGHVLSRHYKDEWDRFDAGASFPMQFGKVDVKATLALVPE
jgi:penicillin amidase